MKKGTQLYRYDLVCPPDNWSTQYKSIEYYDSLLGPKNQIGAFFFYDNYNDCVQTALNAADKNCKSEFYITTCELKQDTNLLHLQDTNIYSLLVKLYEENFDVLTTDFRIYDGSYDTYQKVRDLFFQIQILEENDFITTLNNIRKLITFWGQSAGLGGRYDVFGQRLTDFKNGVAFKRQLLDKGYEGYCFYEGCNDTTPQVTTYCFLSSEHLTLPKHYLRNEN